MNGKWYDQTIEQTEQKLKTNIKKGLSQKVAFKRLKKFGSNIIFPIPKGSFYSYIKHIVTDFTSILLIITAIIAAVFEQSISAAVMIGILILNYSIAIFSYVKAQRILEGMGHFALPLAKVIRDGRLFLVTQEQLAAGDIIYISAGDIIPCDARLIESEDLRILETNLTSEQKAAEKNAEFIDFRDLAPSQQKNMVFASTIVTVGIGKAIVCAVGEDTLVRKMDKSEAIVTHESLNVINILRKYCAVWSLCMIALIFVLTVTDLFFGIESRGLFNIFFTGLSLAVASMSEFYMAFGYIVIACGIFNAMKRYKDINSGAMIKNTSKLAKLKDITCLIIPKEGAFSIKNMRIERIFANNSVYTANDQFFIRNCGQAIRYAVISTGIYGATKLIENNLTSENIYTPEEDAIINIAEKTGFYNIKLEEEFPIVEHVPSSDESLFETTLVKTETSNLVVARGEINKILDNCKYYHDRHKILPMTAEKLNEFKIAASLTAKEAFRIVGVASKSTIQESLKNLKACQTDLIFEGYLAIREPMLKGAAKTIAKCQAAGIKVIMLCEDISENNKFLAETLGVAHDYTDFLNTYEMANMKDGLFRANIPIYRVYEGLTTAQKRLLIQYLQADGDTVGYLARDLDEISLMKECDVSFAQSTTISTKSKHRTVDLTGREIPMNVKNSKHSSKNGCEAIKFISDVIISDVDKRGNGGFNAIAESIACAKVIYINIIRVIKYLLTVQSARLFLTLYSILTHNDLLTPIQILFCGLIIDFAAVIIIAFEKPSIDILKQYENTEEQLRKPLPHNIQAVVFGIFWAALTVLMITVLMEYGFIDTLGEVISCSFISYLLTQIIVLNENMKERSLFIPNVKINSFYLITILSLAVFTAACTLFPSIGGIFGIVTLHYQTWLIIICLPIAMLILYEIYKAIIRPNWNKKIYKK